MRVSRFLRHQRWDVAIVDRSYPEVLRYGLGDAAVTRLRLGNAFHFAADPFSAVDGDLCHVLYEDYSYLRRHGEIHAVTLDRDLAVIARRVVFQERHHLAYPHLIVIDGVVHCLCEEAKANRVVLKRAEHLPDQWRSQATLLTGIQAVDPTLFFHDDSWWLFLTDAAQGRANDALRLYYADDLAGPWVSHPANPVVVDASRARPAGPVENVGGELLRPGQDCSRGYGDAVVVNRIETLTREAYQETPIGRISPPRSGGFCDGLHTVGPFGKDRCIVDLKREAFVPAALAGQIGAMVRRLIRLR